MKKLIKNIVVLVLLCGLTITVLDYVLQNNYGHYTYHMMNEMYESRKNIDVVFLGSSHTYLSYDPEITDRMLECRTFNAGSSAQGMNTSCYLLKEICRYHDVKTVYLDTFCGMANLFDNDAQVFLITDYMKMGENKLDLLYSNGGMETVANGLITYRRNFMNLNLIENIRSRFLKAGDYSKVQYETEGYRGRGFVSRNTVADASDESVYYSYANGINHDFSVGEPATALYHDSLVNTIRFCKENGIELVLVNQPMPRKTLSYLKGYECYDRYIRDIAEEYGVPYWNFDLYRGDTGLSMEYYSDGGHLNSKGAERYTEFFCGFVNDVKSGKYLAEEMFETNPRDE